MKPGFEFYRHMLSPVYYRFARQVGATHAVVHLVDYFNKARAEKAPRDQPIGELGGWRMAEDPEKLWNAAQLRSLKTEIENGGLVWEAIENVNPAHSHDVVLDGPRKKAQLENLKTIIRNIGKVGIPVIGYNFSIAAVLAGRIQGLLRPKAL